MKRTLLSSIGVAADFMEGRSGSAFMSQKFASRTTNSSWIWVWSPGSIMMPRLPLESFLRLSVKFGQSRGRQLEIQKDIYFKFLLRMMQAFGFSHGEFQINCMLSFLQTANLSPGYIQGSWASTIHGAAWVLAIDSFTMSLSDMALTSSLGGSASPFLLRAGALPCSFSFYNLPPGAFFEVSFLGFYLC